MNGSLDFWFDTSTDARREILAPFTQSWLCETWPTHWLYLVHRYTVVLTNKIMGDETPMAAMAVPVMRIWTVRDLRTPKSKNGTFSIAGFLSLALDLEWNSFFLIRIR